VITRRGIDCQELRFPATLRYVGTPQSHVGSCCENQQVAAELRIDKTTVVKW
jgi:hypothetical protein